MSNIIGYSFFCLTLDQYFNISIGSGQPYCEATVLHRANVSPLDFIAIISCEQKGFV